MKTPTRLCAAALAACALLLAPAPVPTAGLALAESGTVSSSILQTAKKANMRKEPDKKSDIRETLKAGTQVEVLDQTGIGENTWAYVRVVKTGKTGYIMLNLLEPVPTPTPTPSPTPVPTPTP
ncbi:MAG: SH3 domain-containing protein, partial [Candidatus Ventricola sp.]